MTSARVVTFYSYKGGVGRTLTLSNIARVLARSSSVLLVDFDLEAPGLHTYFDVAPPARGLVDYLADLASLVSGDASFQRPLQSGERIAELRRRLPLEPYLTPTALPQITLLAAGSLKSDYADRVRSLDLVSTFNASPQTFDAFRQLLTHDRDFVLVDSRTGISEITGLTTALLADSVVAMFAPNQQNLDGLTSVLEQALAYRRGLENPRDLVIYPVASRFDDADLGQLQNWRSKFRFRFEKLLENAYDLPKDKAKLSAYFDQVMLRYVPRYSYGEPIVEDDDSPLYPGSLRGSVEVLATLLRNNTKPWDLTA